MEKEVWAMQNLTIDKKKIERASVRYPINLHR